MNPIKTYQNLSEEKLTMPRKSRQEQALIALIERPTVKEAAEASGISQPTLFRYLQDKDFREEYHKAKRSLLEAALGDLHKATGRAVAVLCEVMEDREARPGARVGAAKSVLAFAIQTGQQEDLIRRLDAVEESLRIIQERGPRL